MTRPTPYFIEHDVTTESDIEPRIEYIDAPTWKTALRIAKTLDGYVAIIRRENIVDETPPEDGTGLIYDWTEQKVWES